MREDSPGPALSTYAVLSPNAFTSRRSSLSAPGTLPTDQVAPLSVVRAYVPFVPLAQATVGLTTDNPRKSASDWTACGSHRALSGGALHAASTAATRKFFITAPFLGWSPRATSRAAATRFQRQLRLRRNPPAGLSDSWGFNATGPWSGASAKRNRCMSVAVTSTISV